MLTQATNKNKTTYEDLRSFSIALHGTMLFMVLKDMNCILREGSNIFVEFDTPQLQNAS